MSIDVWAIHQFKLGGHAAVLASSLYLAVLKCTSDNDLTEESALHTARNQIRKYATKDTQVAALTKSVPRPLPTPYGMQASVCHLQASPPVELL